MKVDAESIEEFFAAAGEQREPVLRELDKLIQDAAPEMKRELIDMTGGAMLGYGKFHYQYTSGREGDWWTIVLANQKNHLSLYVCALAGDEYLSEVYGDKLGKVSIGKSCIRFKKIEDLNLEQITNIVREASEWFKIQPKPAA